MLTIICLYTLKLNIREGGGSSFFTVKHIFSLRGFCFVLQLFHSFTLKEKCYHFQKLRHVEVLAPVTLATSTISQFSFALHCWLSYATYITKSFRKELLFFVCLCRSQARFELLLVWSSRRSYTFLLLPYGGSGLLQSMSSGIESCGISPDQAQKWESKCCMASQSKEKKIMSWRNPSVSTVSC